MKKVISTATLLALTLAVPAMADISQGDGARMPLSQSDTVALDRYAHVPAMARYDLGECDANEAGKSDIHPFECAAGTRNIGSEGGSEGEGDGSSY